MKTNIESYQKLIKEFKSEILETKLKIKSCKDELLKAQYSNEIDFLKRMILKIENKIKIQKLENEFEEISKEIESLELEKDSLCTSEPDSKEEKKYFKLEDKIYRLDGKQFEVQNKIEKLELKAS